MWMMFHRHCQMLAEVKLLCHLFARLHSKGTSRERACAACCILIYDAI